MCISYSKNDVMIALTIYEVVNLISIQNLNAF